MGSPMSNTEDPFGAEEGGEDPFGAEESFGGEEGGSEKPFDDEPFDAGVEADESESPEKFIQQLAGKLGQSLRSYTSERGDPDFDLEKFAINSVLSATNSGEMDGNDQSDIIEKVKGSSTDTDLNNDSEEGLGDDGGEESFGDEEESFDMEESHNPNPGRRTVFQDASLGVKDDGMEENKYLNLENSEKSDIFASKTIEDMIIDALNTPTNDVVEPEVAPLVKPEVEPRRITRRNKPFNPPRPNEDPNPKAIK